MTTNTTAAPKFTPSMRRERVAHWDDERDMGNSLIVSLRDGWRFDADPLVPSHVEGFDTVKDAQAGVAATVPCHCETCAKVTP